MYQEGTSAKAVVGTVSLTDVTFGAAVTFSTTSGEPQAVEAIGPDEFVVLYKTIPNTVESRVGTVSSGTVITFAGGPSAAGDTVLGVAQFTGDSPNSMDRLGLSLPGGTLADTPVVAIYAGAPTGGGLANVGNA